MPTATLSLLITGARACFRRPELHRDLVSYPILPPLVVRRMLGKLDRQAARCRLVSIKVLRPIRMSVVDSLRPDHAGDRKLAVLDDVAYLVTLADVASLGLGTEAHTIHLGLAEFVGTLRTVDPSTVRSKLPPAEADADLGLLPYDNLPNVKSRYRYFNATMRAGIITVPSSDDPSLFE